MNTMIEIAEFLRSRLDEDEITARAAAVLWDDGNWTEAEADPYIHAQRHDPARVLRDVEAGRARLALMIEAHAEMDRLLADKTSSTADCAMAVGRARAATIAVKWDAVVHIAHPDYMPEWKP